MTKLNMLKRLPPHLASKLSPKRHNHPLKRKLVQTELKGNLFFNQRVNISFLGGSLNLIPRVAFLERN